jgi:hypothetical protein
MFTVIPDRQLPSAELFAPEAENYIGTPKICSICNKVSNFLE